MNYLNYLKNIFTSRDGKTFSMTKLISSLAGLALTYQFISLGSEDFQGFAIGISAIVASLAVKHVADGTEVK